MVWVENLFSTIPFWHNAVDGLYFGGYSSTKYKIPYHLSLINSSWSDLSGPPEQMAFIMKFVLKYVPYQQDIETQAITFDCQYQASMPSVFLRYGGYWIEVRSTEYSNRLPSGACGLLMSYSSYWVLGIPAMRGYYISFDPIFLKVGFVPLEGSLKTPLVYDPD